jgi:hypothetical protein
MFIRFQSKNPTSRGTHPGVFALANGLAHEGKLSTEEYCWWRSNNDWYNAACPNPGTAVDTLAALMGESVRLGAVRTVAELGIHRDDAETILRKLGEIEALRRRTDAEER